MKYYEKTKFHFLNDDNSIKEPKIDELYFNYEWKVKTKFPFLTKMFVAYKLVLIEDKEYWIELP
jgi:hypothetical protein